ncbi:hypothetical protein BS50DRAFT_278370 [Corynespora cassiicola Philippines]|uniref:Uncharacterized protein n=1 Tax=Corynespora cassiicola Philippines TaxID=1448308 RepID=A0A2T2P0T6_CORCC|nr:hypothetical protein BS50DRAFT_278370 [Corynespora cassiicola Philippines]
MQRNKDRDVPFPYPSLLPAHVCPCTSPSSSSSSSSSSLSLSRGLPLHINNRPPPRQSSAHSLARPGQRNEKVKASNPQSQTEPMFPSHRRKATALAAAVSCENPRSSSSRPAAHATNHPSAPLGPTAAKCPTWAFFLSLSCSY